MSKRSRMLSLAMALTLMLGLGGATFVASEEQAGGEAALDGYCPVAYAVMGKAVEGKAQFASEHEGRTYYLANARARKMFDMDAGGTAAKADAKWPEVSGMAG